ncbi:MAG TPA: sensor histidine kinase KdpD [bacterium]|nr:sensor histidine kinase KdpD [bacterium]HQI47353.1 sensor histidine kinase KdpD [bacterium]HQJ63045.1 sensor histidine kinase KdpD [bacterium]
MNDDSPSRSEPDALLAKIKAAESGIRKGRLKIFFGMCAGVGKTFAMLREARQLKAEGREVVIGLIETHGRAETEALTSGIERLDLLPLSHREITFHEFHLDAALQRQPGLILVDELAHSNIPGARHPKRYQDVLELLDNGIDVFTTLNVQHLESYATTVEEITGVPVRETVPDSVLERADEIALIDIPEPELLKRLAEGKVYAPEGARRAARGFFRSGNLTALREMALRVTADHVDRQLRTWMENEKIAGPWKSSHRLLAGLSWSPFSAQLIRWTRRMAAALGASWMAVYVETSAKRTPAQTELLMKNMRLAQELGAELVTVYNEDIVEGLLAVARENNVTQIVVGKPGGGRVRRFFAGEPLVNKLIRTSGQIDIHIVRGEMDEAVPAPAIPRPHPHSTASDYGLGLLAVSCVTALLFALPMQINYLSVALYLLFVVTLLSLKIGRGPVLAAAGLSALLWNLLFIPPRFTFSIARVEDVLIFCLYFVIAIVTGTLTAEIRRKEEIVRQREQRAVALYTMSQQLAAAGSLPAIIRIAHEQIARTFDADVALFLQDGDGLAIQNGGSWQPDDKEVSVAQWVAKNRKAAGKATANLPQAYGRFEPLATPREVHGVAGLAFHQEEIFSLDQESLLANFCSQIAAAIERERFIENRHQVELADASEKLFKTLLNSVSHEFRTPLSVISGAIETLTDTALPLAAPDRHALLEEIRSAASRLNALVENLLNMSRLESGHIHPKLEWCDIGDIFSALHRRFIPAAMQHHVVFQSTEHLPLILTDPGLVEQALAHLIENALRYTPEKTGIEVRAGMELATLILKVRDQGPGIPDDALPHIFDKFRRIVPSSRGGTGLGLSISKGLIESMNGTISAANAPEGGLEITLRLPVESMMPPAKGIQR